MLLRCCPLFADQSRERTAAPRFVARAGRFDRCSPRRFSLLVRRFVRVDGAGFTSVFQGAVRFNNYVGTALAAGLFGAKASRSRPYASRDRPQPLMLVFARYGDIHGSRGGTVRQILSNPLVVACALGIAMQAGGISFPAAVAPAVRALGVASMPLACCAWARH